MKTTLRFSNFAFLLAMALVLFDNGLRAQVTNYSYTALSGTYPEITPDSTLGDQNTDDQNFNAIRIGFPFNYNGNLTGVVSASFNGFIVFGSLADYGYTEAAYSTSDASGRILGVNSGARNPNIAAVMTMDIQSRAGAQFGLKREGAAPNRVFILQWKNVKRFGAGNTGDNFNFQVRLHESTNTIEYFYGSTTIGIDVATPLRAQAGIRSSSTDFLCRTGTAWNPTTQGASNLDGILLSTSVVPQPGTGFRYSPIPPAPNDLGVIAFVRPSASFTGCVLTANEPVRVVVRNYGTSPQTGTVASYRVNNGATVTQTFAFSRALLPNGSDTLTFTTRTNLSTAGTYVFSARTRLATELLPNQANDSLTGYTVTLSTPSNLPQPIVTSLSVGIANGWNRGTGRNTPTGSSSQWNTAFPYASENIAVTYPTTNIEYNEWLYSRNTSVTQFSFLIFKASVTIDAFGSSPGANMTDDTVKAIYSENCGATWRTIKAFSQADITANRINNVLQEFRFPLTGTSNSIIVAFVAKNNATPAPNTYRFHLEDIEIKNISPNDLGVTSILSPVPGQPGCVLTNQELVRVVVRNFGSAPQTSSAIAYNVNGGAPVLETFNFSPSPLAPGGADTLTFSLANSANLSSAGVYTFNAFSRLATEIPETVFNDSLKNYQVTVSAPIALPSPLITTFAIGNTGQWRRGKGLSAPEGIISNWSGSFAFIGNQTISVLMPATATTAIREWYYSPTYQGSANTFVRFKLAITDGTGGILAGANMADDTLSVLVSNDCGGTWRAVKKFTQADVVSGQLNNRLNEFIYPVSNSSQRISVALFANNNGTTSAPYRFHLDDVQVLDVAPTDMGAVAITGPVTTDGNCAIGPQGPVNVLIRNYGASSQTSVPVAYRVNGGAEVTQTFTLTPPLNPGASIIVSFTGANGVTFSTPGTYSIDAYTKMPGEAPQAAANDSTLGYLVNVSNAVDNGTSRIEYNFNDSLSLPAAWKAEVQVLYDFEVVENRGVSGSNSLTAGFYGLNRTAEFTTSKHRIGSSNAAFIFDYRLVEQLRGSATLMGITDTIALYISKDCGASYRPFHIITFANQSTDTLHVSRTISLNSFNIVANDEVVVKVKAKVFRIGNEISFLDFDNIGFDYPTNNKLFVANNLFQAFPNPVEKTLQVIANQTGLLKLIDNLGRTVWATSAVEGKQTTINMESLPVGVYQLQLRTDQGIQTQKVMKN